MPHRAHLFSLRIAHALREACLKESYSKARLLKDFFAGVTVGIVAIPLAMALAIAIGVAPQYGLYTAFIAGFVIALTGGSRYSISGPTAAFVVILYPVVAKYGLGGLLVATLMAGAMLVAMAYFRLGRFIEYIPESVTLGFTGGIAIVIVVLQIKDVLGLTLNAMPEHFVDKLIALASVASQAQWPSAVVASFTLFMMLTWRKLKTPVPPHLPAVFFASLLAIVLNAEGYSVDTIGSRFSFDMPDGSRGVGIPPFLPSFEWPWLQPAVNGTPIGLSWTLFRDLLPTAFAIAMLGAIESLLCAVVLDGMTGKRHSANSELLGQGIGNIVTPFFGGVTATAALARSATNVKAGATSPISAIVHALVVLSALLFLGPILAHIPMAAMAALLIVVAWNMSEAHKSVHLIKTAPRSDIWVFVTCISITVLFDMVMAITAGILLAAILFMKEIAELTKVTDVTHDVRFVPNAPPAHWHVYKIDGPLFFAAADRIFGELSTISDNAKGIVLYLEGVPLLDAGGLAAMSKLVDKCQRKGVTLFFAHLQFQPLKTLARAHVEPIEGVSQFYSTLNDALQSIALINNKNIQTE